jgi:hypothetical protein
MNTIKFKLGTGIAKQYPFQSVLRIQQPVPKQKDYSVITKKILVLFTVVVIIKISILLFWI